MELMNAIHERKSYRKPYKPDPIPAESIKEILEAGVAAPSGCNQQTTRFIGVNDPELAHKLAEIYDKPWALTAPAAILLLTREHVSYRGNSYHIHDYSAAAENILLAAVDKGYATTWIEGQIEGEKAAGQHSHGAAGRAPGPDRSHLYAPGHPRRGEPRRCKNAL